MMISHDLQRSRRHSSLPYPSHPEEPPSPTPSSPSGADTPPGAASLSSSTFLPSSVSSLWGGLVRRFSSDTASAFSPAAPAFGPSLHHSQTEPAHDDTAATFTLPDNPLQRYRTASPMRPPPLEPLTLSGYREDTSADARLLSAAVAEELRILVPTRLSIVDTWNLVYSLDQDGASLATLYEKCRRYEGKRVGFVLVVKDLEGSIFGAYLSDFPHPAPKYFGTGECFLWRASMLASLPPPPSTDTTRLSGRTTTLASPTRPDASTSQNSLQVPPSPSIRFKAFPYSGVNEYYMFCETHFLSVGAGDGKYGLWLNDSLARGISSTCQTFGNERLSDEGEKFGVLGVEVWVIGGSGF